ncbi:MAG TPA: hypothetical protein VLA28_03265 [Afifellaceae bacterium]|nr:hypothetical protein [Afifellaceae bacterium]
MCDYSLEAYRSKPAQEGVGYETHRFTSHSIGFIAPGDVLTAVCMACGMRLRLEDIPEPVQRSIGVTANEVVTFTRLETGPYRDGVRFANGREISLQQLGPGVRASVIDALTSKPELREAVVA